MFSPFTFLDVVCVALLVCKFSDILNMSLSNGKHVQKKQRTNEIIEQRMSTDLYASNLERKQEKWIVGMQWGWCRGYSHMDKAWPSRLLPPPWMCPRGSKIESCSFWTYVITSRRTSVSFWWMAFSITGGSEHWAVSDLSANFRIFVCLLWWVFTERFGADNISRWCHGSAQSVKFYAGAASHHGFLYSVTSRWCNIPSSPEWISTDFQNLLVGIIYWILECLLCWCSTWTPCSSPVLGTLC